MSKRTPTKKKKMSTVAAVPKKKKVSLAELELEDDEDETFVKKPPSRPLKLSDVDDIFEDDETKESANDVGTTSSSSDSTGTAQQAVYAKTAKESDIINTAMRKQEEKVRIDAASMFFKQTFDDMRKVSQADNKDNDNAAGIDPNILKEIEELMQKAHIAQTKASSYNSSQQQQQEGSGLRVTLTNIFAQSITNAQRLQRLREHHNKLISSRELPQIGFSDIQRTLIPAVTYKLQTSRAVLVAPPCAREDCVGLSTSIRMEDGLQDKHRGRLMCWMTKTEYDRWRSTGKPPFECEKRRCFLCDFICQSVESASCMYAKHYYSGAEGMQQLASQIPYIVCTGTDDTVSMQAFENAEAADLQENGGITFAVPLVQLNLLCWKRSLSVKSSTNNAYIDFSQYRGSISNSSLSVLDPIKAMAANN